MTVQLSVALRDNRAAQIEATVGVDPFLDIREGAQPANCAAADTGTELFHIQLPTDWLTAPSAGVVSKNGAWSDNAVGTGVGGHFRIKETTDTTCHLQGSVTGSGGGGDIEMDNTNVTSGQSGTVNTFTWTEPNP